MPLRFRSVVPYTLPGVLALIGWWWYISRKKERLVSLDSPNGAPTTPGLAPPAEDSNSLVEKGPISPTNDTENPTHRPPKVSNLRTKHENFSQVHGTEAVPSIKPNSEKAPPLLGRLKEKEVHTLSALTQLSPCKEDGPQRLLKDKKDLGRRSIMVKELEDHLAMDPASAPDARCQSTKVTSPTLPTTTDLSDAARPEPEGEVAKHYSTVNAQDEMVVCAATTPKVLRGVPSEADSLETPPSAWDFHQHILTSTPTSLATTSTALKTTQDSATISQTEEDTQALVGHGEDQDLELLAAGLITEVISAATQEILGVTSCQVTQPTCSSQTQLTSGNQCSQQETTAVQLQQHHLLTSLSERHIESGEPKGQGIPNGCSSSPVWEPVEVSHRAHQTNHAQKGHWLTPSHQAAQSTLLPTMKLKGDEAVLADDSACSTCHSEDGMSNEDPQYIMPENQIDAIQVTDLSAKEATRPQSLDPALEEAEGISLEAVCEFKRLNGMALRNGAHGTCEGETDQSGGSDVNSMDSVDSGCTMGAGEGQTNHTASSSTELIVWEIEVPKHLVGRLIGKQGRYVSFLKQNSGAKIYISTLPYTQEFQICHIEGTQQQVDKALSLIGKKFKDLDLTNLYAPPPPALTLPSLPMTSWLLLPSGVTVEVIVVNIVSAGHVFVQQHTHPTYHALRSLDQQMFLCYSQPGTPALPSPAEVGVICAAPAVEEAWWRAQVITFYKETNEVEIRYVDYGGYDRVKIDSLRQIRSDFVTLPFQGAEVLLDNVAPLPGEDRFSPEATAALEEMTRGVALLAQVSNYDNNTGLPLVHLWNMVGEEVVSVNRTLAERGLGVWLDGF
ncbi:A kinase (PRKA) anchor protein 1b [Spinachia spinachia]